MNSPRRPDRKRRSPERGTRSPATAHKARRRWGFESLERRLLLAADFGDAPAPYATLAPDGAWHTIAGPRLGALRDAEVDGLPTAAADGDGADDDGVTFGPLRAGQTNATVIVNVQNLVSPPPQGARLDAWIDFNADGNWGGPGEQIFDSRFVEQGDNILTFAVPANAAGGTTYARFRLSTAGGRGVTGPASDGEVEDYQVTIGSTLPSSGTFVAGVPFTQTTSSFTTNSRSIAAGDLDGDGDADLAVGGNGLVWYENAGGGVFALRPIVSSSGVVGTTIVDMDGDSDADILFASGTTVGYRENLGPSFTSSTTRVVTTESSTVTSVLPADVDGDGDVDVLVAAPNRISWRINEGNHNFSLRNVANPSNAIRFATAADVDGDGDLDVLAALAAGPNDSVVWFENVGGQFAFATAHFVSVVDPVAAGMNSLAPRDIDGDGDMDFAYSGAAVGWFENDGAQNFTQRNVDGFVQDATIEALDVDGDGDVDLAVTMPALANMSWYENDGQQTFAHHGITSGVPTAASVYADFDGDGALDIGTVSGAPNAVASNILLRRQIVAADYGDAPATYGTADATGGARHRAIGPQLGALRDVDADGAPSAAADGDGADEDGVAWGALQVGQLGATLTVKVQNAPAGARVDAWIDFNGDGSFGGLDERILAKASVANGANVLHFDVPAVAAAGSSYARVRLSTAGVDSYNGAALDGEVEDYHVAIAAPGLGGVQFGGPQVVVHGLADVAAVHAADLDRDGDMDVITAFASSGLTPGRIVWNASDGAGGYVTHVIDAAFGLFGISTASLDVADLDVDGDLDVIAAAGQDQIYWYRNDGGGVFTKRTPGAPVSIATIVSAADVDGDGLPDLVSTRRSTSTNGLSYFRNNGDGTFDERMEPMSTQGFTAATPVDLNRDGRIDVIATSSNNGLAIHWNQGGGNLAVSTLTPIDFNLTVSQPLVTDIDDDGDLDFLVTSVSPSLGALPANSAALILYRNDNAAAGSFTRVHLGYVPSGGTPNPGNIYTTVPYTTADLDADGDVDIAGNGVWVENMGNLGFVTHTIAAATTAWRTVTAADADGDGDLDLLAALPGGQAAWFLNQGGDDADFGDAPANYPTLRADGGAFHGGGGPQLGALRDAETEGGGSGLPDDAGDDGVTFGPLRAGDAAASVVVNVQNAPAGARLTAWVDFNGNGVWSADERVLVNAPVANGDNSLTFAIPSSAVSGATYARFRLSTAGVESPGGVAADGEVEDYAVTIEPPAANTGDFTGLRAGIATGRNVMHIVDLDGDGDFDVVTDSNSAGISWHENLGSGAFLVHNLFTSAPTPDDLAVVDLDRDGDLDIIAAMSTTIYWFENNGAQSFRRRQIIQMTTTSTNSLRPADFDGDGDVDLLIVTNTGFFRWHINDGRQRFGARDVIPFPPSVQAAAARPVDLDGDGDMDIVAGYLNGANLQWLENTGGGVYAAHVVSPQRPYDVATADIDGDGDLDIVARFQSSVSWFERTSTGAFTAHALGNVSSQIQFTGTTMLAVADLDGDGDMDVATPSVGRSVWFRNDGAGGFAALPIGSTPDISQQHINPAAIAASDINGDGRLEIIVSSFNGSGWYEAYPRGDYNRDGQVDQADRDLWQQTNGQAAPTPGAGADGDRSGTIDDADLAVWEANVGEAIIKPTIPANEPFLNETIDGNDFLSWQRNIGRTDFASRNWDWDLSTEVDVGDLDAWRSQFGGGVLLDQNWIFGPAPPLGEAASVPAAELAAEPAFAPSVILEPAAAAAPPRPALAPRARGALHDAAALAARDAALDAPANVSAPHWSAPRRVELSPSRSDERDRTALTDAALSDAFEI